VLDATRTAARISGLKSFDLLMKKYAGYQNVLNKLKEYRIRRIMICMIVVLILCSL
jgi:hypothetical protein